MLELGSVPRLLDPRQDIAFVFLDMMLEGLLQLRPYQTQVIESENGSQYIVTDKVKTIETVEVGKQAKATYDERDGKNMVSELEEVESPSQITISRRPELT
jgi:hypothetical protein